jgi:hypothetical protein
MNSLPKKISIFQRISFRIEMYIDQIDEKCSSDTKERIVFLREDQMEKGFVLEMKWLRRIFFA